jgi:hypothetical protein
MLKQLFRGTIYNTIVAIATQHATKIVNEFAESKVNLLKEKLKKKKSLKEQNDVEWLTAGKDIDSVLYRKVLGIFDNDTNATRAFFLMKSDGTRVIKLLEGESQILDLARTLVNNRAKGKE